jgi:alcohol dehydrogenase YqhD (iron-dependent ADH family)
VAHGRGLATLYPTYFNWLWEQDRARDRFALLGQHVFGIEGDTEGQGRGFIDQFTQWLKENELYQSLPAIGVDPSDYQAIAEYAVQTYGNGASLYALGPLYMEQITELFAATEKQV